jgi:HD-GYP domain-containing protein (c-di-GMP phosphodiesterase class II)
VAEVTAHRLFTDGAAARTATVRALEAVLIARDPGEAAHLERATAFATALAERIDPALLDDPGTLAGFRLHDLGKLALPDATLHRRGPLTPRDWRLLHRHPLLGADMVAATGLLAGADAVVRCHHERWDGHGYPAKRAGEDIPIAARVFAVADALDAITSDRPYRAGRPLAEAREAIRTAAGTQFDPRVAAALDSIDDDELDRIRGASAG